MFEADRLIQDCDYLTPEIAERAGISKFRFYKYVSENGYERIGHGVYLPANSWIDELYLLHLRCPLAVFSHEEALYYHNLTDREPVVHTLTVYSGYNVHRLKESGNCRFYFIKKELLDIGNHVVTDNCGNNIPLYDLERTICDIIRSRNTIEKQEFSYALKTYVSRSDKDLNKLMEYAKLFNIDKVVRSYLEILL